MGLKDYQLIQITNDEIERVIEFYNHVIVDTPGMNQYARWKKGMHPTEGTIRGYMQEKALQILEQNGRIVGAMAVTLNQGDDYHAISWGKELKDNEVAVIHILAADPDCRGQGIAQRMIDEAIELAYNTGKKAVRLDALASNTPAHRLYEKKEFVYRDKDNLYVENTGWTDFFYNELLIE